MLGHPKPKVVRDPQWLQAVRQMPCHLCGQRSGDTMGNGLSEASHLDTKSRDDRVLPMCGECHRTGGYSWHSGQKSFCEYWGVTKDHLIAEAEHLYRVYRGEWKESA